MVVGDVSGHRAMLTPKGWVILPDWYKQPASYQGPSDQPPDQQPTTTPPANNPSYAVDIGSYDAGGGGYTPTATVDNSTMLFVAMVATLAIVLLVGK